MISSDFLNLVRTGQPAAEPVTLAAARLQCKIDEDMTDDDPLISGLIVAARDHCENYLSRAFVRRTFQLRLGGFPFQMPLSAFESYAPELTYFNSSGIIPLPYPPLVSVEAITYTSFDGSDVILDPAAYVVEAAGDFQGYVIPAYGVPFPYARYQHGAASTRVDFTAGYSSAPDQDDNIPGGVKAACLLLVAHWYRNREATSPAGQLPKAIELGLSALLSPYEWGAYA
jgi:uncharacterized phiE125 gp8 family phage protein